jgi:multicomponent Na+:H+ antiporter subunit A
MLLTVLAAFAAAAVAPALHRASGRHAATLLALVAAGITMYFAQAGGDRLQVERVDWVPVLGLDLSFRLDGLSRLFALLIAGIGSLILLYAGPYMAGHQFAGRLLALLLAFLGSMLGLVLAGNILTLYVFWELTSVTSYLLIGFEHERPRARAAALQALVVTTTGGLAMLAGLVLLGQMAGSYDLSVIAGRAATFPADPRYPAVVVLVLAGAFTKSAQFPFHFWLPNAMEAPTPVSAYLHSSTMVKAGLYLLARLSPALGGTALWFWSVSAAGAVTMIVGAAFALAQTEFKRILAYSTVSALGLITLLIGIGSDAAATAAMAFLLAHAFYKGALFLVAGIVSHETGEKSVEKVGGLAYKMPMTAAAALLAALSMAGLPPFVGFIGKELAIEAALGAGAAVWVFVGLTVATGALLAGVAGAVGVAPFFTGSTRPTIAHEGPAALWVGPLALAALGLCAGLAPGWTVGPLVESASAAMRGAASGESHASLGLWHGFTPTLMLGLTALVIGALLYARRDRYRALLAAWPEEASGGVAYASVIDALQRLAYVQTRWLQSGSLRRYLRITMGTAVVLVGARLVGIDLPDLSSGWRDLRLHEALLVAVVIVAAATTTVSRSRLGAVAALGVVGYGVALIFVQFGAPDLAMTQFVIETLTVLLLVFALYRMPPRIPGKRRGWRWLDMAVAGAGGVMMTLLALVALDVQIGASIAEYFLAHSLPDAHGRNVVNVILVDFRGADTMGEITVLGLAATGVYALLKLVPRDTP